MHHHGYIWVGEKTAFDNEALRRPPHPHPPPPPAPGDPAAQRLTERYREVVTAFPSTGLPPLRTAHWLLKRGTLVRGTWTEPKEENWGSGTADEPDDRHRVTGQAAGSGARGR